MNQNKRKGRGPTESAAELGTRFQRSLSVASQTLFLSDAFYSSFLKKFLHWLDRSQDEKGQLVSELVSQIERIPLPPSKIYKLLHEVKEFKVRKESKERREAIEERFSSFLLALFENLEGLNLTSAKKESNKEVLRLIEQYFSENDRQILSQALDKLNATWNFEKSAIIRNWQGKRAVWLAQMNFSDEEKGSFDKIILAGRASENGAPWIMIPLCDSTDVRDSLFCYPSDYNLLLCDEWEHFSQAVRNTWLKKRLQEELRENLKKMENLYRYESLLLKMQDRATLVKEIANAARDLVKAETAILSEFIEKEDCLRPIYALHPQAEKIYGVSISLGKGVSGLAALRKEPIMVLDPKEDDYFSDRTELPETALLSLPLFERDQLFAVLTLAKYEDKFENSDLLLLQSFGQMARVLLENLKFSESNRRKFQETQTLLNLSREINSAELEHLLQITVRQGSLLVRANGAMLFLKQPEASAIELKAFFGEKSRFPLPGETQKTVEALARNPVTTSFSLKGENGALVPALGLPLQAGKEFLGALFFLRDEGEWQSDEILLADNFATHVGSALKNKYLLLQLEESTFQTVTALWKAFDAKDRYSAGHVEKVTEYGLSIAGELRLSLREKTILRYALLLHDIGKIGIPEHVLNKPGPLTPEEWELMKLHPAIGATILKSIAFLESVVPVVLYHHERWDGLGYPNGLKGEEIPLLARIVAVADAYHAMTSSRPYRSAKTKEEALKEIEGGMGTQFDPRVAKAFLKGFKHRNTSANT